MSNEGLDEIRRVLSKRRTAMKDAKVRLSKSANKHIDPHQYLTDNILSTYAAGFEELYGLIENLWIMNAKHTAALNELRNAILKLPEVQKDKTLYMKFKRMFIEIDSSY
jgi:hypothetical protein